jgi:integrase
MVNRIGTTDMARTRLNEDEVKKLPAPERGSKVHYFAGAMLQGVPAPNGFGVRVTAGGVKSFVLNYRAAQREHRITIGQWPTWSTVRAVKEARELRRRVDKGENPLDDRNPATGATLKEIAEDYLRRDGAKLRSIGQQRGRFERVIYPAIGDRPIADIRRSDVVRLLDQVEDERGPHMAHAVLAHLSKLFNWYAIRHDDFRSPLVRGMGRVKKGSGRERALSDDEIRAVWSAAGSAEVFGAFIRFLLLTATRRTEAAHMKRSELTNGDWIIPGSRMKGNQEHVIPLSAAAQQILASLPVNHGFIFSTTRGRAPIGGYTWFKDKLDETSGVRDWRLHDLRRTARSLMSRAGVAPDIAERCLAHTIGGVRGVYDRHAYHAEKRAAFIALANLVDEIVRS